MNNTVVQTDVPQEVPRVIAAAIAEAKRSPNDAASPYDASDWGVNWGNGSDHSHSS